MFEAEKEQLEKLAVKFEIIGNSLLINDDCLKILPTLGKVDAVITDLPYGTTACKWDSVVPLDALWIEYERLCQGAVVLTAAQPFTSALVMSNLPSFKYEWIWEKTQPKGHLNAKIQPMRSHESVLVFCSGPPPYNPQMTSGHARKVARSAYTKEHTGNSVYGREVRDTAYDSTDRYPRSVQVFANADLTDVQHPTEKPVALFEYLVKTYTNTGMTVLDNTMGSGTTGVACMNLDRKFIGIEIDRKYFDIACERIERAQQQLKLF